jgi:hypothetical protein
LTKKRAGIPPGLPPGKEERDRAKYLHRSGSVYEDACASPEPSESGFAMGDGKGSKTGIVAQSA